MLGQHFFLDDEIDGVSDFAVEHEYLFACNLGGRGGTESRREIILDLRYSRKSWGSKILSSLLSMGRL